MASGPMKPDQAEMPPTYPVPPPYGADPGYGFGPAVYPMQSGPSPSVSSTNYGVFQTQPGYPQSPPTQVAWADHPPPWSPAVQGQPMGYMSGPPGSRPQPYQQQQQVVVIGTSGPSTAIPIVHVESFAGHIVLSCFVLWCCNMLFGLIAFILAAVASSNAINDPRQARSLGKASYGVSIAGIVVTAVVITIVVSVVVSANSRMYNNLGSGGSSSLTCNYYYYNSVCYRTYSRYYTMSYCTTYLNGYYYGSYCYYNY